jgi:hypothetical protein
MFYRKTAASGQNTASQQQQLPNEQEMREKRRKLLELKKRGKARARTLMYHVATESDVMEILTDFTIDFLLKVFFQIDTRQEASTRDAQSCTV